MFPSESEGAVIDLLKEIPKKNVGISLAFKAEQSYTEEKLAEPEEFSVTAKLRKFGGVEKTVRLHVNTISFMEEDVKDGRVILKQALASLMFIKIKKETGGMNTLKLCLPHSVQYKCRLRTHELDFIVSSILHSLQTKDESDYYVPFIMLESAELSTKVYGLSGDVDSAFENSLKKEIEEATGQGELLDQRVKDLMFDAAFNANFKSSGFDGKFLALLFALLADLSQILLKLEKDPLALQSYEDFIAKPSSAGEKKEEAADSGRVLQQVYLRLPPLLTVIKNMLFWRVALPDIPAFQKQIETLIALSGCRNAVVAINASLALRSLLKVC